MTRDDLERELARLHGESFGWALACCRRDRPDAEDVLQTAYLRVLSGRATFGGRSAFRTWWFGVIRITALEEMRRVRGIDLMTVTDDEAAIAIEQLGDDAPDASFDSPVSADDLASALTQLSDRQREAVQLVFYHDLTVAEAAEAMGVSLGSARTHYDRGKKALAALLAARVR